MAVLNQTPCYEACKAGGGEHAGTSRINRDEKEIQNGLKAETCYIVTLQNEGPLIPGDLGQNKITIHSDLIK